MTKTWQSTTCFRDQSGRGGGVLTHPCLDPLRIFICLSQQEWSWPPGVHHPIWDTDPASRYIFLSIYVLLNLVLVLLAGGGNACWERLKSVINTLRMRCSSECESHGARGCCLYSIGIVVIQSQASQQWIYACKFVHKQLHGAVVDMFTISKQQQYNLP